MDTHRRSREAVLALTGEVRRLRHAVRRPAARRAGAEAAESGSARGAEQQCLRACAPPNGEISLQAMKPCTGRVITRRKLNYRAREQGGRTRNAARRERQSHPLCFDL